MIIIIKKYSLSCYIHAVNEKQETRWIVHIYAKFLIEWIH